MSAAREPRPPEEFALLLRGALPRFGLDLPPEEILRLASFLSELDRWRRRIDLTGRLSAGDLAAHAIESLVASDALARGAAVIDVGTGGGFPGVPLAIHRPDLKFTWLEPREKRSAFLRHAARSTPVDNADVVVARIEDVREASYDAATSRAVGSRIAAAVVKALRRDGRYLVWTTRSATSESSFPPAGLRLAELRVVPGSRERVVAVLKR